MKIRSLVVTAALAIVLGAPLVLGGQSAAAAPAGDVSSDRVPGWVSCDDGPDLFLSALPASHLISCADANSGLKRLAWTTWTATSATGKGIYYWNDCEPSCAAGTMQQSRATVELTRVRVQAGEPVFTRAIVTYTDTDGMTQVLRVSSIPYGR